MKNFLFYAILPFLALTACTALADVAGTNKQVILTGTFNWTGRKGAETLEAVLTPSGTNTWKAVFTFTWDKKAHTYTGSITGHLDNGDVSGEATADSGGRTFGFKGHANNGAITYNHFETTGGKNKNTGAGTLKSASPNSPVKKP